MDDQRLAAWQRRRRVPRDLGNGRRKTVNLLIGVEPAN